MAGDKGWRIDAELQPGERLLWKGRPDPNVRLRSSDGCAIPFSVFFSVIAVSITIAAFSGNLHWKGSDDPVPFLFVIPFVLAALYLLAGRFFIDARSRRDYEYALTDRRAIILSGTGKPKVKSVDYLALPSVSFDEDDDGVGTIYFTPRPNLFSDMYVSGRGIHLRLEDTSTDKIDGFDMISNVRDVFRLILKARKERSAR